MAKHGDQREVQKFIEDFGLFLERMGMPRMAGRIWAWLLICDPPHQSAAEIAEAVRASRGSVSTMTRMLVQFGLIERQGITGARSRFFRIKPGGFTQLLEAKLALTTEVRGMAERGLELLADEPPEVRRRLQEYRDFYAFFEKEIPVIIEKWERRKARR